MIRSKDFWSTHWNGLFLVGVDLRGRLYDKETGKDVSLTDGRWIITLAVYGLFGFLAEFGLLAMTIFRAASGFRFAKPGKRKLYLTTLALIIAVNMVDLLPNASLTSWTWLLVGALLGRAEAVRSKIGFRAH